MTSCDTMHSPVSPRPRPGCFSVVDRLAVFPLGIPPPSLRQARAWTRTTLLSTCKIYMFSLLSLSNGPDRSCTGQCPKKGDTTPPPSSTAKSSSLEVWPKAWPKATTWQPPWTWWDSLPLAAHARKCPYHTLRPRAVHVARLRHVQVSVQRVAT